jgi:hypothetical protein
VNNKHWYLRTIFAVEEDLNGFVQRRVETFNFRLMENLTVQIETATNNYNTIAHSIKSKMKNKPIFLCELPLETNSHETNQDGK